MKKILLCLCLFIGFAPAIKSQDAAINPLIDFENANIERWKKEQEEKKKAKARASERERKLKKTK